MSKFYDESDINETEDTQSHNPVVNTFVGAGSVVGTIVGYIAILLLVFLFWAFLLDGVKAVWSSL